MSLRRESISGVLTCLIKVFEKMRDEIQGTILIISHQERILDIADKIVVIAKRTG